MIDDVPDATAVVPNTDDAKLNYDPNYLRLDRASGSTDVRHRLAVNTVWKLNYAGSIQNSVLKNLAQDWELAGIFTAQSGLPYTALIGSDLNADGNSRTERVPGFGRNTFNQPAIYSLDPRITRTIKFHEKASLQLIGEAFDVLNHSNFTGVRTTMYSVSAGKLVPQNTGITAFGVPSAANIASQGNVGRVLQLAAKITF